MNYSEQRQFLKNSQLWASGFALILALVTATYVAATNVTAGSEVIIFGLIVIALAVSLSYTPAYLHLTVDPGKPARWQYRIRWRVLGAALVLGMVSASGTRARTAVLIAVMALGAANLLARKLPAKYAAAWYWMTDLTVIAVLLLSGNSSPFLAVAMLAGAAHLSIVICQKNCFAWAAFVWLPAAVVLWISGRKDGEEYRTLLASLALLAISALATAWMAYRAQRHNARNVATAIRELADFTGYSEEKIRHLWQTSNQQLAENWQKANLAEDDQQRMAEWYRQNSELYMFAISGYNLEHRRIRSNLGVLKYARGATLDYGAGNGELLLELAWRGHATMYYDVEGTSMAFARRRAQQRGLKNLLFARSKDELAAAARECGFDTVFSFDVLEHLPDLAAELNFLASLLAPGGRMVFDVPAGSTKAHPMHLNHNLNVKAHLSAKGMQEERTLWQKLAPFKQEKFIFRKPA